MDETHSHAAAETHGVLPVDSGATDHPAHDDHHDVSKHVNKYLMVGGVLIACTALTVFLSYVNFGTHKANMAVGMVVATFKACLVAAIFMHLSSEKKLIYRILIFTGFFVFALFWLTYFHWYDPISR